MDLQGNESGKEDETETIQNQFKSKIQSYAQILPPSLIECTQTQEFSIKRLSDIAPQDLHRRNGNWSIAIYNPHELEYDFFNSSTSCFENVATSDIEQQLSLVTCKSSLDSACRTKVCVPFCCGNILVHKNHTNITEDSECRDPLNVIRISNLTKDKIIDIDLIENDRRVSIINSDTKPYYIRSNLKGTCHMNGEDEYEFIDMPDPDYLNLVYNKSFDGYRLQFDKDLLARNEYCIAKFEMSRENKDKSLYKRIFKVKTCGNKRWFFYVHGILGPILCCVSIAFLLIAIVLEWNDERFKLSGALRICLLSSNLLLYVALLLKRVINTSDMLRNHSTICIFYGFSVS